MEANVVPMRADTRFAETNDGQWIRKAVIVDLGTCESVDVVDGNGQVLMRLNIFNHDNGIPSIDVINMHESVNDKFIVQTWVNGIRSLLVHTQGKLVSLQVLK
jgi:hypothetical protein